MADTILPSINSVPAQGIQATLDLVYLWNPDEAQTLIDELNSMQELMGKLYPYSALVGTDVWQNYPCYYNNTIYVAKTNLTDLPETFDASQWTAATGSGTASVWGNITGTLSDQTDLQTALDAKQDELTAGTNITITDNTISATDTTYTAGTGIDITDGVISNTQTSAEWGNITGTLSSQTDLQTALDAKQNNLPTLESGKVLTNDGTNLSWTDTVAATLVEW